MRVPADQPFPAGRREATPNEPKAPKRRIGIGTWLRRVVFIFSLAIIATVVIAVASVPKRYNILVIGSDQRAEERGRSDVLMVLSLSKSPNDPMTLLTIPRDTRVEVPGFGAQKITHAYALGERDEGSILGNAALTKATVEQFLNIRVDGTIEVTFASFETIINNLGGIAMKEYGKIDGAKALEIVRDRARAGGDFARTDDQRELFLELFKTIRSEGAFTSVYDMLKSSQQSRVRISNLRFGMFAAYALVRRGGNISLSSVHNGVIPGSGKSIYTEEFKKDLYYWVPDEAKTREFIAQWMS